MLHKALQNKWVRVLIAVFATFLYALGVNLFIVPMGLYSGGVVGLSQVIRTLIMQNFDLPAGVDIAGILYFLINIPVLYLAWRDLGRGFLLRTLICVGASSFFLSVVRSPAVPILEDPLASCLVGGHSLRLRPWSRPYLRLLDRRTGRCRSVPGQARQPLHRRALFSGL